MKIISIIGCKGGQGRTNVCVNLAASLSQMGNKVLCIDLDPQSNMSSCFGIKVPEELPLTIVDYIEQYIKGEKIDNIKEAIQYINNIDLIPSTVNLKTHELALQTMMDSVYAMQEIISGIKDEYDYILIDCNSDTNSIYNISALVASNECILPTQAQYLSTDNIQITLSIIQRIRRKLNRELVVGGILLTMAQFNTNSYRDTVVRLYKDYSEYVNIYETIVPFSIAVSDSNREGVPIITYAPKNKASIAYKEFAMEVVLNGNR